MGAVVADHLQMPSLTQVIKIDVADGKLRCERQAEYGYDTVEVELPAVISVGDAINEPRYPSLKAIMGAKKKQLDKLSAADAGIEAVPRRRGGLAHEGARAQPAARQGEGHDHRGRGHERDGREDRRLARGKEADLDGRASWFTPSTTTRATSTRTRWARSRKPPSWPASSAPRRPRWSSATCPTRPRRASAPTARRKVYRAKNVPEGLAQPIVDAMAKVIQDDGFDYVAVRRRPARLRDRRRPDRAAGRRRDDGGHRREGPGRRARRRAPDPAGLPDRGRRTTWASRESSSAG